LIANSIEQIYEGDKVYLAKDSTKKELDEFLENLTADQMKKLTAFYNSMPRLEHKLKVKNPKTNIESEVTLKGLASFFA
jgi:4-hydroxyphenylpyruvate dioxygenase-like putative hemolysin